MPASQDVSLILTADKSTADNLANGYSLYIARSVNDAFVSVCGVVDCSQSSEIVNGKTFVLKNTSLALYKTADYKDTQDAIPLEQASDPQVAVDLNGSNVATYSAGALSLGDSTDDGSFTPSPTPAGVIKVLNHDSQGVPATFALAFGGVSPVYITRSPVYGEANLIQVQDQFLFWFDSATYNPGSLIQGSKIKNCIRYAVSNWSKTRQGQVKYSASANDLNNKTGAWTVVGQSYSDTYYDYDPQSNVYNKRGAGSSSKADKPEAGLSEKLGDVDLAA